VEDCPTRRDAGWRAGVGSWSSCADGEVSGTLSCECGRVHRIRVLVSVAGQRTSEQAATQVESRSVLSAFERRALQHVAEGLTDREAAKVLGVSVGRVRYAVRSATGHLAARTRSEAIFLAVCTGQLECEVPRPSTPAQSGAQVRLSRQAR
jgi:DNA-binding CsgD family transcriptional regulator